jgi:heptosyltransferase I
MPEPRRTLPRHVCIVLLTGLGDVVHGMPVASALKRAWPARRITWVTEPPAAGLLQPHPAVDEVIVYRRKDGWAGVRALWRRMRHERFDLTLNLMPYFKSNWPTAFSLAPERWTFGRDRARDGVWLLGNRHLPRRARRHTADMLLEFVEALGVDPEPVEWRLVVTEAERALQRSLLAQLDGRPGVAITTASANARKDWPAERYVPVVDAIQGDLGARVVLIGGPGEREVAAARLVAERATVPPVWLVGEQVRSLIWAQDACAAALAPDTGPLHIARALAVPVVGLFGHTNPWRVGPWRAFEDLWVDAYSDPGEAPDPSHFASKPARMERIEPADVIDRVARALARGRHGAR